MARCPLRCKRWNGSSTPTAIRSSSCGKSNDRFAPGVCKGRFKVFVFFLFVVVFEYCNVLNISMVISRSQPIDFCYSKVKRRDEE